MANLPRFHRRKKDVAPPTLITNNLPRKSTQSSSELPVSSPRRSFQKFSPFRVFHRSSGKRARDSPPESSPHSPAAAPAPPADCTDGRPVSPVSLKMETASDEPQKPTKQYKMPSFLCLSDEGEFCPAFYFSLWDIIARLTRRDSQRSATGSPSSYGVSVTGSCSPSPTRLLTFGGHG